ncbi:MAG: type III-B CRISPR module RAMP protein Cmr6 [candidate division WOR-3 bacterium]
MNLPLPHDTHDLLSDKHKILATSNLGLLFNKYVYTWQNGWQMKEAKNDFLKEIAGSTAYRAASRELTFAAVGRHKALLRDFSQAQWHTESFEMITDSRLIIGLGSESVLETGITLHPLYGFPYLPGSGLKGIARAYAETVDAASPDELRAIFGSEDKDPRRAALNFQGKVFFLDGIPTAFPSIEVDIMNPHFREYYQGDKPPADYLSPEPVTFLAVAAGHTFAFALLSRESSLAAKARNWLVGGLTTLGAGGKTNVGYGYFRMIEPEVKIEESVQVGIDVTETGSPKTPATPNVKNQSASAKWPQASLSWRPNDQTLVASFEGKKAERKINAPEKKEEFVPERFHKKLFIRKESVKADVFVEQEGKMFTIVKVE